MCAGLLHAAYLQGDFGLRRRRSAASRRLVVRALGAEAEEIVWRYRESGWEDPDQDPRVLLVRLANELEETLDLAPLFEGPRKREQVRRSLESAILAAERQGLPELVAELSEARDLLATESVPKEIVEPADWSYTEAPLSYRRRYLCALRDAVRAVVRRLSRRS